MEDFFLSITLWKISFFVLLYGRFLSLYYFMEDFFLSITLWEISFFLLLYGRFLSFYLLLGDFFLSRLTSEMIPVMRSLCQDIDLDVRACMCGQLAVVVSYLR